MPKTLKERLLSDTFWKAWDAMTQREKDAHILDAIIDLRMDINNLKEDVEELENE